MPRVALLPVISFPPETLTLTRRNGLSIYFNMHTLDQVFWGMIFSVHHWSVQLSLFLPWLNVN